MGLFGDIVGEFYREVQGAVNDVDGDNYAAIYYRRYPGRYHKCACCGKILDREIPRQCTIDHIVPQHLGGTNAITNLQPMCQSCNSRKKAQINALTLEYSGAALIREIKRRWA